ncbi:MAG: nucleotidyltransferase family protein [Microthrixaceae bacterium]|jgi:hypothetical protein|nr:nucleotidyltransferase family protein [Microthrixaceae bacterium]
MTQRSSFEPDLFPALFSRALRASATLLEGGNVDAVDKHGSTLVSGVELARLVDICVRYGVAELSVFGSVARAEDRSDSDIDLLYVLAPGRHLGFGLNALEDELQALFGRRVDLVSKAALHRLIRENVLAEAQPLYAA